MSNNYVKIFLINIEVKFFLIFLYLFLCFPNKLNEKSQKMKSKQLISLLLILTLCWGCKPAFYNEITQIELEESINFLAGDSLKGRFPATAEDLSLTEYIVNEMDIAGLTLMADEGKQEFGVSRGFEVTKKNQILVGNSGLTSLDYKVLGFSSTDTVSGEVLSSYNFKSDKSADISGRILMLPFPADLPESDYDSYGILRSQCLDAADQGAIAVIYVYKETIPELDHPQRNPLSIPVIAIESDLIDEFIEMVSADLEELFSFLKQIFSENSVHLIIEAEVIPKEIFTYNTVGHLKGNNPEVSDQFVIIGAHHDHLGMGGRGSSSRHQDTVATHYGADDNASGVAGVIEIAQHMISRSPDRSFVFTTFGAEELGLHGSKYFSENPTVDLSSVQAMINLDMIGRLNEERQLQIGGIGTSPIFRELLDSLNTTYNFTMAYSEAGYGPSDHSSFYAKDVPVLFISTGAHPDYHTPSDSPDKINFEGMLEVLHFVSDLAYELSNMPEKIEFTLAGPKESSGSRGREGMVTFGLMPDVMYDGNEGMPVSFVTEGKPAAIGGMKGGDIIKAVDEKRIGNVHDYMERLSELKEGQTVLVTIERDGIIIDLLLKL
jgi:hypothetical protein